MGLFVLDGRDLAEAAVEPAVVVPVDPAGGGPLDVGEIHADAADSGSGSRAGWMDVVRPALQRRMQRVLAGGGEGHIQYNLLAIVDDPYLGASDELELLKRERAALERRLAECFPDGWASRVRPRRLCLAPGACVSEEGLTETARSTRRCSRAAPATRR